MKDLLLRLLTLTLLAALGLLSVAASNQGVAPDKKAAKPRITDFAVAIEGQDDLVSFKLVNALDENRQRREQSRDHATRCIWPLRPLPSFHDRPLR